MYLARLVTVSRAEQIPEQFKGFLIFQADLEGHEISKKEKVALLVIEGTSCYIPVFLDRLKEMREIEERLAEQQAEMNEETRSVLAKNIS